MEILWACTIGQALRQHTEPCLVFVHQVEFRNVVLIKYNSYRFQELHKNNTV